MANLDGALAVGTALNAKWSDRISKVGADFWTARGNMFTGTQWAQMANEVLPELFNQMALDLVMKLKVNNPLSSHFQKNESFMLGNYVRMMGVDVIQGYQFQGVDMPVDQFAPQLNQPNAQYFAVNREYQYMTTTPDQRAAFAFQNEGQLSQLLAEMIAAIDTSNELDRYVMTQGVLASAYLGKIFTGPTTPVAERENQNSPRSANYTKIQGSVGKQLLPTQKIEMPNIGSDSATNEDIRKFVYYLRNLADDMTLVGNRRYNAMGRFQASSRENLVIILNYAAYNQNVVQNQSGLFNPEMNAYGIPVIKVDGFGEGMDDIVGMVVDKSFIQIYTNLLLPSNAVNAASHYRNYFLTTFETYGICHFHNAAYLIKPGKGGMKPTDVGFVPV